MDDPRRARRRFTGRCAPRAPPRRPRRPVVTPGSRHPRCGIRRGAAGRRVAVRTRRRRGLAGAPAGAGHDAARELSRPAHVCAHHVFRLASPWICGLELYRPGRGCPSLRRSAHSPDAPHAAAGAETVAQDPLETIARSLVELGRRLDAELWLYRRGVLVATSSPALAELGLVDPFLAPQVFRGTLEDELETTIDARTGGRPTRVGFLIVAPGPSGEQGVLAVPQLLDDERIRGQREDLTFGI